VWAIIPDTLYEQGRGSNLRIVNYKEIAKSSRIADDTLPPEPTP
jgi:hypothetical protein